MSCAGPHNDAFAVASAVMQRLHAGETVTARWLASRFGVSRATSKRYMERIEVAMPVVRVRVLGSSSRERALALAT
ncbi:MAG TPA: HTH domain-containing protein [Solimonas sp.]